MTLENRKGEDFFLFFVYTNKIIYLKAKLRSSILHQQSINSLGLDGKYFSESHGYILQLEGSSRILVELWEIGNGIVAFT